MKLFKADLHNRAKADYTEINDQGKDLAYKIYGAIKIKIHLLLLTTLLVIYVNREKSQYGGLMIWNLGHG